MSNSHTTHSASTKHSAKPTIPPVNTPVVHPKVAPTPEPAAPASAALDEKTPHSAKALQERALAKHRIATEHDTNGSPTTAPLGDDGKK